MTAQALLPSTSVITFTLGNGLSFTTFVNTVPINATRTINRFSLVRKLDIGAVGSHVFNMDAWDRVGASRCALCRGLLCRALPASLRVCSHLFNMDGWDGGWAPLGIGLLCGGKVSRGML